jgi:3-deoxy-D-manno-octulosonate 8-phosphate phosphatase (KDO 8-P phosphatase)
MSAIDTRAAAIRLACFDVDGTLTDGRLYFDSQGQELKAFHVHDGQGLRLLEDAGISVALITARRSSIAQARGRDLRLKYVFDGVADKLSVLQSICAQESISLSQVAYMGDDYPDLACLQSVGLAACPADALMAVRQHAHWCSRLPGGAGAARELADLILSAQGQLSELQSRFGAP